MFQAHRFSGIAPGFITEIVEKNRDKIDSIEKMSAEDAFEKDIS